MPTMIASSISGAQISWTGPRETRCEAGEKIDDTQCQAAQWWWTAHGWRAVTGEELKNRVFVWVCRNPGKDDEDVAEVFGIPDHEAVRIVGELLDEGILGFDE